MLIHPASISLAALLLAGAVLAARPTVSTRVPATRSHARIVAERLPLAFEENRGQASGDAAFVARGAGYSVAVSDADPGLIVRRRSGDAIAMRLLGAKAASAQGVRPLPGRVHYLRGGDPRGWRRDIPTYAAVSVSQVYPGVDLVCYGTQRQLEYDFVVAPGHDPAQVRLGFGSAAPRLNQTGDLLLRTEKTVLRQARPVAYQTVDGLRKPVSARYELRRGASGTEVALAVGEYDHQRPLVIDPVLSYSTYLGGEGNDGATSIAVDGAGSIYLAGTTASDDFPTANALQPDRDGNTDVFITKITADGTAMAYSTFVGGIASESAGAIAVDTSGNAYVAGTTASSDFPTALALKPTLAGPEDAFVLKLNSIGSKLEFSTYLGGGNYDEGADIAVDASRSVYVTGRTLSADFPISSVAVRSTLAGLFDAFVTKLSASGSQLLYSTYLGGAADDAGQGIAVDIVGNAYICGRTESTDFPQFTQLQRGLRGFQDAFVTKILAGGRQIIYSTYVGGAGFDQANRITVDKAGNAYLTGTTSSLDFPNTNSLQHDLGGFDDAFVTKINTLGTAFAYSTFLGGEGVDSGSGIAVDATGSAYVTGTTASGNFPIVNGLGSPINGPADAFVARVTPSGGTLRYSTVLGGSASDAGLAIAVQPNSGDVYVAGQSGSRDFPTVNPLRLESGGSFDAFVAKLTGEPVSAAAPTDLRATPVSDTQVNLTWRETVPGEERAIVQRKAPGLGDLEFTQIADLEPGTEAYSDTGLQPLTQYVYRVYATSPGGDSAFTSEVAAFTTATPIGRIDVPGVLKFSKVKIHRFQRKVLSIHNAASTLLRVTVTQPEAPFSVVSPTDLIIGARQRRGVTVQFAPTVLGAKAGTLTLTTSDPAHPTVTISLRGKGRR